MGSSSSRYLSYSKVIEFVSELILKSRKLSPFVEYISDKIVSEYISFSKLR